MVRSLFFMATSLSFMVNFQLIDASQRLPIHSQDEPEEDPSEQSVLWDMTRRMETHLGFHHISPTKMEISPIKWWLPQPNIWDFANENGDLTKMVSELNSGAVEARTVSRCDESQMGEIHKYLLVI